MDGARDSTGAVGVDALVEDARDNAGMLCVVVMGFDCDGPIAVVEETGAGD